MPRRVVSCSLNKGIALRARRHLMVTPLDDSALDTIFRKARTQNKWFDKPVSREQLAALYDLMRWGPTSANCFPVRIVFVTTPAAKERLKPLVLEGNRQKVTDAPVTAIIGYNTRSTTGCRACFRTLMPD